ncbi:MAG TPA: 2-oxoacid:acceptor oxidoreductase family protein [Candidatus Ozemobacteraceae bacterium]|nr:2-oxoacid:acceptor oxidoreductase family protein [Candidatus Ozemobacteraceae bacterium]
MTQPSLCCDLYLIGVGGQGIGLLAESILRAADAAGMPVRGVDTHGLAQRGGTVTSHVRIGNTAHSPLVRPGAAHVVVALERHEALRGMNSHLRDGGTLVYYDCELQPLPVRLGKTGRLDPELVTREAQRRGIRVFRTKLSDLPDPRMQNIAVLAALISHQVLPGLDRSHFEAALTDLMQGAALDANLALLRRLTT